MKKLLLSVILLSFGSTQADNIFQATGKALRGDTSSWERIHGRNMRAIGLRKDKSKWRYEKDKTNKYAPKNLIFPHEEVNAKLKRCRDLEVYRGKSTYVGNGIYAHEYLDADNKHVPKSHWNIKEVIAQKRMYEKCIKEELNQENFPEATPEMLEKVRTGFYYWSDKIDEKSGLFPVSRSVNTWER